MNKWLEMNLANHHKLKIRQVCDFIHSHIDDELTLKKLCTVAACSKFHFHRLFSAFMGVSVIQYVLLTRLKRASYRLAFETEKSITDIAYEAHFESPEAFSRAFSRVFEQSPTQFRRHPEWSLWHSKYQSKPPTIGDIAMDVTVLDFTKREVALIEHRGDPQLVFETAKKFITWRKTTGLSPIKTSETFGVPYGDPNDTPLDDFRFDICGSHIGEVPNNDHGVIAGLIPGGRCAMAVHHGSHDSIGETIYYLYQKWLPESGKELRDYPCFFRYVNLVHEVDEKDLLTEVYLPIY